MSFIVEDGSGVKDATSYTTVQFFKNYTKDRGIVTTSFSGSSIQAALIAATDYIDTRWASRLKGSREWIELMGRSVLTLSGVPSDGESVTIGSVTYVYKNTPTTETEVKIGSNEQESLTNLSFVLSTTINSDVFSAIYADEDLPVLTIYTNTDDVPTTETLSQGSFNSVLSSGKSRYPQRLQFPRVQLYDDQRLQVLGVPHKVKKAAVEYALRAINGTLSPDPVLHESGLRQIGIKTKVGAIEEEYLFADFTDIQITKPYPAADRLLQEYVRGNTSGVIRA